MKTNTKDELIKYIGIKTQKTNYTKDLLLETIENKIKYTKETYAAGIFLKFTSCNSLK